MKQNIYIYIPIHTYFPGTSDAKASAYNVGDPGLIPGSGRSSGEGNGNPLQYSCLGNPMNRGACRATVQGAAKESVTSQQLNNNTLVFSKDNSA